MHRHTNQGSGLALTVFIMIVSACGTKPPVTATSTSTLPSTQAATNIPASTFTPISTPTTELTATPLLTPTPFGGGAGRIAYVSFDGYDLKTCEIYAMNIDGSNPIQLTKNTAW